MRLEHMVLRLFGLLVEGFSDMTHFWEKTSCATHCHSRLLARNCSIGWPEKASGPLRRPLPNTNVMRWRVVLVSTARPMRTRFLFLRSRPKMSENLCKWKGSEGS